QQQFPGLREHEAAANCRLIFGALAEAVQVYAYGPELRVAGCQVPDAVNQLIADREHAVHGEHRLDKTPPVGLRFVRHRIHVRTVEGQDPRNAPAPPELHSRRTEGIGEVSMHDFRFLLNCRLDRAFDYVRKKIPGKKLWKPRMFGSEHPNALVLIVKWKRRGTAEPGSQPSEQLWYIRHRRHNRNLHTLLPQGLYHVA